MDIHLNKIKRVCDNCGQNINIRAKECPYCHTPQPPLTEKQKAVHKSFTIAYLIMFIIMGLPLIIMGFFLLFGLLAYVISELIKFIS